MQLLMKFYRSVGAGGFILGASLYLSTVGYAQWESASSGLKQAKGTVPAARMEDSSGRLIQEIDSSGLITTYTYTDTDVIRVEIKDERVLSIQSTKGGRFQRYFAVPAS